MRASDEKVWQTTAVQNLVRYAPSGTYFARFRVGGKLVWKSLETAMFSVAKQRLPDTLRDHRSKIESFTAFAEGKMTVGDAAEVYLQKVLASVSLKPRSKDYREMMIDFIRRSWPSLFETDVRKISLRDCEVWLSRYQQRYSASVVNNSIGTLRAIFETRQKPMVRTPPRLYLAGSSNSFVFADSVRRFHDVTVSTYRKTLRGVIAAHKTVLTHSPLFLFPLIGVETIFNWLYSLPDVGIALLFGAVGACLLAGVPFLREKLLRIQVLGDESEFVSKALSVVVGFTGVVLAFSLVQAHNNLRNLEAQVGTEAHNLAQLDRLLIRYGNPEDAIRVSLREYANSIVRDEWPELSKGRPSERTRALFRPISRGILAIDPPPGRQSLIYAEMLKKADEIAADRKARVVAATKLELPWIFWETIGALLVVLLLLAAFSEVTFVRAVALGGQGFGLALLVALVFIFDEPFKGHSAVSPEPIVTVVAEMQTRTE